MKKSIKRLLAAVMCAVLALAVMLAGCTDETTGITSISSEQGGPVQVSGSDSSGTDSTESQTSDTSGTDSSSDSTSSADSTPATSSDDSQASDSQASDSQADDSQSGEEQGDDEQGGETDPDTTIITAAGGYEESLYVTWETNIASNDTIRYKLSSEDSYTTFTDSNLIREENGEARLDIVGLTAGDYDIQIISGGTYYQTTVTTEEYDRSGYAHFNYTDGVGAYNDDGTLKNNTVVIYLTDNNKNDITNSVYLYKDGALTQISASTVKGWFSSSVSGYGIGYLLNNNTYGDGISKITDSYAGVTVRVAGTVNAEVDGDGTASEIEGLTVWTDKTDVDGDGVYDKNDGDGDGDNGRMARMVGAKNVTIEGIGEDATIYGWGFHFICSDTTGQTGCSFEVRNLTFSHYSEDAIGMEGKADGTTITAPVQRCWIHNNSFYVGYCEADSTWEGDKGDGDGSCDFKRGEYFTFSYNYLENCHKTNLIGAGDTCPQYNITIHHNYYNNCSARMPLIRMANLHYYNNYVYGAGQSAISSRATNYTYSEYNYYENNKVAIEVKTGDNGNGAVKSYNDVFVTSDSTNYPNTNAATVVTSRTQSITNACYDNGKGVDYSTFDTSTTLFYYDNYKLTTDATQAKAEVIASAGAHGTGTQDGSTDTGSQGGTTSGTSVEINISQLSQTDLNTGTLADGYELGTGVYVSAANGMPVNTSNKTYNGTSYTYRLQTGGYVNSAAIKIVAAGACTVTVHLVSSNSSQDREVGLFSSQSTSSLIGSTMALAGSTSIVEMSFKITSAGTYYLGTIENGINIYYIAVTY